MHYCWELSKLYIHISKRKYHQNVVKNVGYQKLQHDYIPIKQFFCPVTPLNAGEIILMISSWSNHSNKPMSSTISHIDWTTIGCFQSFKLTRDAASLFFNVCAYLTLPIRIHELENASVNPSSFHEIAEGLRSTLVPMQ